MRPAVRSSLLCLAGRLGALVACLMVAAPSAAEWRRVETPNFVVIGEVGAGDLREIAVRFEAFREALSRIVSPAISPWPACICRSRRR